MTDLREKIAEIISDCLYYGDAGGGRAVESILALFADTIKDAERFRFEHSVSNVKWMLEIERRAISIPWALPMEWWRQQIDEAIAAKGAE